MEDAGRPATVLLERAEKRRAVAGGHPRRMDRCSSRNPSRAWKTRRKYWPTRPAMSSTSISVIRYRSSSGRSSVSVIARFSARSSGDWWSFSSSDSVCLDELVESRKVAGRPVGEPTSNHHCLQVDVEPCRDQRLVAAGHHHQVVDELVVGPAPASHLFAQRPFLGFGHRLDDQHLEVGPFLGDGRCRNVRGSAGSTACSSISTCSPSPVRYDSVIKVRLIRSTARQNLS